MDSELDFEKRYRLVREVIETVVLTLLMFLVIRQAVQNFNIEGHSMETSLHDQELILVDKWSYLFHPPARGDVIVFKAPPHPDQDYIKRIIGLPGDIISIQNTQVYVNNKLLKEVYVNPHNQGDPYQPFTNKLIPPNTYFVLGDNRAGSSDSRDWGCVPRQNIIGRAALVYWPFGQDNDGLLPNYSSVFSGIGQPPNIPPASTCTIANPASTGTGATTSPTPDLGNALLLITPASFVLYSGLRKRGKKSLN